jgi:hypothetical protein
MFTSYVENKRTYNVCTSYLFTSTTNNISGKFKVGYTTDPEARVLFPALPEKSSGSGTGSTQPREFN